MASSVLVVEDQWVMQDLLKRVLQSEGHHVETASTALEALARARACDPDLVILDAHLPGGNGWDVLPILRRERPACPVVMTTGDITIAERDRLQTDEPDAPFEILEKPFALAVFRDTVRRALAARESALGALSYRS